MLTFSLLAIWLFARWRSGLAATASFTLGTLVKYLCGLGLAWVVVADVARASSLGRRGVVLAASAIVCASIVILVAWPWLELPDSLEPILAETATVGYVNALPENLALALAEPLQQLGAAPDLVRAVERGLIVGGFLIYLGFEARRVGSHRPRSRCCARRHCRSCCTLLLVSTSVQPWYFTLPVALAAGLGWRSSLTRAAVGYSLLTAPALYLHYYLRTTTPWWVDLVYGLVPLLAAWGPGLWARARTRLPAAAGVGLVDQGAGGRAVAGWVRLTEAPGGAPRTDRSSTVERAPEPPAGNRHRGPSSTASAAGTPPACHTRQDGAGSSMTTDTRHSRPAPPPRARTNAAAISAVRAWRSSVRQIRPVQHHRRPVGDHCGSRYRPKSARLVGLALQPARGEHARAIRKYHGIFRVLADHLIIVPGRA